MSLLAWYPLLSNGSNQGLDNVDLNTMGTVTYTDGKLGKSSTFTGNAANCLHRAGFKLTDKFTWACWFKVDADTGTYQYILSEGRDHTNIGISLLYIDSVISIAGLSYISTVTKGIWYHVALTVDSADKIKVYLDGKLVNSYDYFTPNYTQSSDRFTIGKISFGYTSTTSYFPFYGQVCDVRIYDEVLSEKEIYEISKGLVLHYPLKSEYECGLTNKYSGTYADGSPNNSSIAGFTKTALTTERGYNYKFTYTGIGSHSWRYMSFPNITFTPGKHNFSCKIRVNSYKNVTLTMRGSKKFNMPIGNVNITKTDGLWHEYSINVTIPETYTSGDTTAACTPVLEVFTNDLITDGTEYSIDFDMKDVQIVECDNYVPFIDNDMVSDNIIDCSGFGNHGTRTDGITWDDNAIRYNGSYNFPDSKYIIASPNAKVTDQITVNIWCYMDTWEQCRPFSCTQGGGWNLESNNGYVSFPIYAGNAYQHAVSNINWTDLTGWHMFTGTWNGYSARLYIDGELAATTTALTTKTKIVYNSTNSIFLHAEAGTNATSPEYGVAAECNLSDFRIYATALSDEDVKALYNTKFSVDNQGNFYCGELVETILENSKFNKNSILECVSVIEENEKLSIGKYGEIYTNNINEL